MSGPNDDYDSNLKKVFKNMDRDEYNKIKMFYYNVIDNLDNLVNLVKCLKDIPELSKNYRYAKKSLDAFNKIDLGKFTKREVK